MENYLSHAVVRF